MLNIISNEYFKSEKIISGPTKVFRNLVKGLDIIDYPYIINGDLNSCNKLWIYNDPLALKKIENINKDIKILLGPGFFYSRCLGEDIKNILREKSEQIVCLQPSKWSRDMLVEFGYDYTCVEFWPTGIDTEEFKPYLNEKDLVLVYFKNRYDWELEVVEKQLKNKNINYKIIIYGNYNEKEYLRLLRRTKYIVWVGRQESQGIALQEALSTDVPILVWDVKKVGHWSPSKKDSKIFLKNELEYKNTTVAPYFDDTCGLLFYNADELEEKIMFMENNYKKFKPRDYILNNLSLKKQALDFLNIFEKRWGLKIEEGYKGKLYTNKKWKNEFMWKLIAEVYFFIKKF